MKAWTIAGAALFFLAQGASAAPNVTSNIAKAVADPSRPANDRASDANRKPAAVLAFAGVHPGETVADYLPGGGYSRVCSPRRSSPRARSIHWPRRRGTKKRISRRLRPRIRT